MLSVIDLNAWSSVLSFSLLNSTNNCSITRAISTMELNVRKHVEKNGKQDFSCLAQLSQSNKKNVFNNKTFHIWLFHTQLTFQFRWKVNISALSTMRPIIKAIDGRKEKEQELGSDGYNHFSSGNIVVLNVQWSLLKYMTGKLKKCFSSQFSQEIHRRPLSAKCHMKRKVTLTRSSGVCPSLFFFVASAPCLSSNFTISYLPWNEIEFSEAKRRRWSNLGSSFMQRGELP